MDKEIVARVVKKLASRRPGTQVLTQRQAIPFSKGLFSEIIPRESSVVAVDGSNMEILGSSSFSLQLIRVCVVMYEGKKRTHIDEDEFYALCSTIESGDLVVYEVECYPGETFTVELDESTLRQGEHKVTRGYPGEKLRLLFLAAGIQD